MPGYTWDQLRDDYETYARLCLRIAVKDSDQLSPAEHAEYERLRGHVPLRLNFSQRKVQQAIDGRRRRGVPPRIVELKSRQVGMSTDAEGRLFHICHTRPNQTGLVIAHKRESAKTIFRMAKKFYENLPANVRPEKRHFTTSEIEFEGNGSRLQVEIATPGGGRGYTPQGAHLSEYAQYSDPGGVFGAVMNGVPDAINSLVIVESTPLGMNEFHDLYVDAKAGNNDFVPIFIPWFDEPTYRRPVTFAHEDMDEEERSLAIKYNLDLEQIAWRRWTIRNKCKNDKRLFMQENPSDDRSCFLISGRPVFEPDALEWYGSLVPPHAEFKPWFVGDIEWVNNAPVLKAYEGGPLILMEPPKERHLYIVGTDPSEGDPGSDPSPHVIMDRMTLEPVGAWIGRKRPDRLAHVGRSLCVYYNKAHHIWESNNHGLAYGITMEDLYWDVHWRRVSADSVSREITDKPGYNTSVRTRHLLFDNLKALIDERLAPVRIPQMVAEMGWLRYNEKGQPEQMPGRTKDLLVAYALCLEAHRGSPDNVLEPMSEEQRVEVTAEIRRIKVAKSMGIEVEPIRHDRLNMTAEELEAMDDEGYKDRRARLGLGRSL